MPENNEEQDLVSENKVQNVLVKNINLIVAILVTAFAVFSYFNTPLTEMKQEIAMTKQDLIVAKENHLEDIAMLKERIVKIETTQETTAAKISDMSEKITRILTILEGKTEPK